MSLSFCVLGSGSGGNSTLVICGPPGDASVRKCFLVDCGLSPRATAKRMAPLGVTLDEISAILLTHFDTDHFYPGWLKMIQKRNLPVHAHKRHRNAAWAAGLTAREVSLFNGSLDLDCGVQASTMLMAHDDLGSVSFVLDHAGKPDIERYANQQSLSRHKARFGTARFSAYRRRTDSLLGCFSRAHVRAGCASNQAFGAHP